MTRSDRFVAISDQPFIHDLACADLYRQPSCAAAWRDAFDSPDLVGQDDAATKIGTACATAYCPHLTPGPALCSTIRLQELPNQPPRIDELRTLDTAILELEGVAPSTASAIAARVDVFASRAQKVLSPTPPPDHPEDALQASLVLSIPIDGDVNIGGKAIADGDLDGLFRAAFARDKATQVIFKVAKGVQHERVVNLMERAKQTGLTRLAVGTSGD